MRGFGFQVAPFRGGCRLVRLPVCKLRHEMAQCCRLANVGGRQAAPRAASAARLVGASRPVRAAQRVRGRCITHNRCRAPRAHHARGTRVSRGTHRAQRAPQTPLARQAHRAARPATDSRTWLVDHFAHATCVAHATQIVTRYARPQGKLPACSGGLTTSGRICLRRAMEGFQDCQGHPHNIRKRSPH